jgi:hypothetical protein
MRIRRVPKISCILAMVAAELSHFCLVENNKPKGGSLITGKERYAGTS